MGESIHDITSDNTAASIYIGVKEILPTAESVNKIKEITKFKSLHSQINYPLNIEKVKASKRKRSKSHDEGIKITVAASKRLSDKPKSSMHPSPRTKHLSPIAKLHHDGYHKLAEISQNKHGIPWDEILNLEHSQHIEELLLLHELIEAKEKNSLFQDLSKMYSFGLKIAKSNHPNTSDLLGQLIYLIDFKAEKLEALTDFSSTESFEQCIIAQFQDELKSIKIQLDQFKENHAQTNLQNDEIALKNRLPIKIAEMLITSTGAVNAGLIPAIRKSFITDHHNPMNYEINLEYTLKCLQRSPDLREKIRQINNPQQAGSPAAIVIRTTLGIAKEGLLPNNGAKITALTALLSHLRQGKEGACFATPLAIEMLTSHLDRCVDDFKMLLESNLLKRKVNGGVYDFPFLLRIGENGLGNSITFNREGKVNSGYLWQAPGIKAACDALGFTDTKSVMVAVIESIFNQQDGKTKTITIKQLLEEVVKYITARSNLPRALKGMQYVNASFAFQAQTNNPLLKIWENSIAGMAEAEKSGMIKSTLTGSLVSVLKSKINEIPEIDSLQKKTVLGLIKAEILERVHLQYDPVIENLELSRDNHSTDGAFVLYDKCRKNSPNSWSRIDNSKAFQSFVFQVLKNIGENLGNIQNTEILQKIIEVLIEYSSTNAFLEKCLVKYFPQNSEMLALTKNYEKLKYTPWITQSGNNFSTVIQTYSEQFQKIMPQNLSPAKPEELLETIINLGKSNSVLEKECYIKNPYKLTPMRVPEIHAFSLMLGHPSIHGAWTSSENAIDWINDHVLHPGIMVSLETIDDRMKNDLLDFAIRGLVRKNWSERFKLAISTAPKNLSISQFRNFVMEHILDPNTKRLNEQLAEIALKFDLQLYNLLPEKSKDQLKNSAVHFADTNWAAGVHDVHFCFTVNPGTGKLEIWAVNDNGSNMLPLDQKQWLNNRVWEFFQ